MYEYICMNVYESMCMWMCVSACVSSHTRVCAYVCMCESECMYVCESEGGQRLILGILFNHSVLRQCLSLNLELN